MSARSSAGLTGFKSSSQLANRDASETLGEWSAVMTMLATDSIPHGQAQSGDGGEAAGPLIEMVVDEQDGRPEAALDEAGEVGNPL